EAPKPEAKAAGDRPWGEGWKKTVPVPDPAWGKGDQYLVWVEGGWLHVKRQAGAGQTDWHIVLAKATDPKPPEVGIAKDNVTFAVSYRDGRYFIRETLGSLRCVRERKQGEAGTWPRGRYVAGYRTAGSAGGARQPPLLSGWMDAEWFTVVIGPDDQRADVFLRLDSVTGKRRGFGFQGFTGDLRKADHG